jgi:hypothetical protein
VQYYLAVVALERAGIEPQTAAPSNPKQQDLALVKSLETIRNRLSFPADTLTDPGRTGAPSPQLRVLRSGFNSPRDFDPYAKQPTPDDPGGKTLFELFDEAFRLLTRAKSTS